MTPQELAAQIRVAVLAAISGGNLLLEAGDVPTQIVVDRPKNPEHGDWATNVAMQLSAKANSNPRAVAEILVPLLNEITGVAGVEIAGPGFINIRLSPQAQQQVVREVLRGLARS